MVKVVVAVLDVSEISVPVKVAVKVPS